MVLSCTMALVFDFYACLFIDRIILISYGEQNVHIKNTKGVINMTGPKVFTNKKILFWIMVIINAILFVSYITNRKNVSNQCAEIYLDYQKNSQERMLWPDQPELLTNKQIWLITKTAYTLNQIKQQGGYKSFTWGGLLDSFDHHRVDKIKREFWIFLQNDFPELNVGEFSERNFAKLVSKDLPQYLAKYWIFMMPLGAYFSYDIFGYITNSEFSTYFCAVSIEKRKTKIWGEVIEFDLAHIMENLPLEGLNYEPQSSVPSYAFVTYQTMFLDERVFYKIAENSTIINEYKFRILKKDIQLQERKMSGQTPNDLEYIKNIWAIEEDNSLYGTDWTEKYNQALDNVIAHEAAHIYDSRHNLIDKFKLPFPNTLHNTDTNGMTLAVNTEYNAFASEIVNGGNYKSTIANLIYCWEKPKNSLEKAYPHGIAKNRLYEYLAGNRGSDAKYILSWKRFFYYPREYIEKTLEMKKIFEKERGNRYYFLSKKYLFQQYIIFIVILANIFLVYVINKKYVKN